ncbi:hypothetical protein ITJ44_14375 [Clavibacter sp. VKM Ac-2873]|uniref:hypothetical protein n=1 Tax=Clavibacter sp. VKM Ac-2873 TaxID=2783813 RepID=UPI00188C1C8E|nr:hypothetical protein [Clavibacter sp. VKM Ac-2873]MBF4619259.1 hypothetical protein [Clavibacter sp. VKM Ac-2873]
MNATTPRRRHLAWIWPLLAMPVVFLAMIVLAGGIFDVAAPSLRWLLLLPFALAFLGPAGLLVLSVVRAVRLRRDARGIPRAPHADPVTRVERPPRRRRPSLAAEDAARRGLTREEYGVYKGSVGSAVEPVNSAGGLLVISIALTVWMSFVLVLVGIVIAQEAGIIARPADATTLTPVEWFFGAVTFAVVPWSWRLYVVERRAQKLRLERGLPKDLR